MGCNHHPATRSKTSSTGLESPGPLPTGQITGSFHSQEHNIWVFSPSPGSILVLRQGLGWFMFHPWVLTFINPCDLIPSNIFKELQTPTNFGVGNRDSWLSSFVGASARIFWSPGSWLFHNLPFPSGGPSRRKSWMIYNSNYYPQPPTQKILVPPIFAEKKKYHQLAACFSQSGNALKKMVEFSFLRSKLALNFETDVFLWQKKNGRVEAGSNRGIWCYTLTEK